MSQYTPYIGPGWVLNVRFKCLKISVLRPYTPCIGPGWVLKMRFKTFRNHRCSVISEIIVKHRRFLALCKTLLTGSNSKCPEFRQRFTKLLLPSIRSFYPTVHHSSPTVHQVVHQTQLKELLAKKR